MIRHFATLLCVFLALLFSSCALIEINGLKNDYEDLNASQKALVLPLESFEKAEPGFVYKLTMPKLKEELEKQPKAIVRIFNANCKNNESLLLPAYYHDAQKNGYALYQIMVGYAGMENAIGQAVDFPLFVIDNEYYKTSLQPQYVRYFTNELIGLPRKTKYRDVPEELTGHFYYFDYGRLTKVSIDF